VDCDIFRLEPTFKDNDTFFKMIIDISRNATHLPKGKSSVYSCSMLEEHGKKCSQVLYFSNNKSNNTGEAKTIPKYS
jgi:hypothetical protein